MKKESVMKRLLYFAFIFMLILPVYIFCQDEAEPFSNDNEQTVADNSVNVSDIFAGDEPVSSTAQASQGQGGDNYLNAMSDSSKTGIEQKQSASGITAKEVQGTPTPIAKSEAMFQSNEINIADQAKTKQQIDKDVQDLFKEGKKYYDIEDYEGAAEIWFRIITNYPTAKNSFSI